ncbi:MAG: BrnT family toxin [Anaerolineae bacterium]|nr:BrnT family toxin [Anaerolineae bacterium]
MRIEGFIWLEEIVEKLEVKHGVVPDEIEEVFVNRPKVKRMNRGHVRGEDVYRALGQTEAGRYLVVFFIHKMTREALALSARDMDTKERKSYAR